MTKKKITISLTAIVALFFIPVSLNEAFATHDRWIQDYEDHTWDRTGDHRSLLNCGTGTNANKLRTGLTMQIRI